MGQTTIPDRQHTLEKASTIPSLHGKFTCSGHGVVLAASRSAPQPAGCAGWIELLRYSLMPLGDFARRRSPCFHRSSMAMPPLPPCRDHSVTESALSGCLYASKPHTHGSFRRCRVRSRDARFDARSSIKPSVLVTLGGIDAASPMAHSSTTFIPARRLRLEGASPIPMANLTSLGRRRCSLRYGHRSQVQAFGH